LEPTSVVLVKRFFGLQFHNLSRTQQEDEGEEKKNHNDNMYAIAVATFAFAGMIGSLLVGPVVGKFGRYSFVDIVQYCICLHLHFVLVSMCS